MVRHNIGTSFAWTQWDAETSRACAGGLKLSDATQARLQRQRATEASPCRATAPCFHVKVDELTASYQRREEDVAGVAVYARAHTDDAHDRPPAYRKRFKSCR